MKTIKRTSILLVISMFIFLSAFNPVISGSFVYADSVDNWTQVTTTEQMAEAFRYYCKSRNLTIDTGSNNVNALDSITSFTTRSFRDACNSLGINMDGLQAHLKYETDNLGNLRYFFDATGVSAYNRIFAEFLQNNDLEVGDSANANDNIAYSGYSYTDDDGYFCLLFVVNNTYQFSSQVNNNTATTNIVAYGTPLKYDSLSLIETYLADREHKIYANNTSYNIPVYTINSNYYSFVSGSSSSYGIIRGGQASNGDAINGYGYPIAYIDVDVPTQVCIGRYSTSTRTNSNGNVTYNGSIQPLSNSSKFTDNNLSPVTIFFTTNNTVINNNNYEGDTIINNDGTPSTPSTPDPEPDPEPSPTDDWDIEMPDLDINWIISGKENKFPFNIPFNIMFALSLLNAEPEAPHFQGTINLGLVQWNYDIDLSPFNNVASLCRNLEFLAFIIGLMFATKQLIWG